MKELQLTSDDISCRSGLCMGNCHAIASRIWRARVSLSLCWLVVDAGTPPSSTSTPRSTSQATSSSEATIPVGPIRADYRPYDHGIDCPPGLIFSGTFCRATQTRVLDRLSGEFYVMCRQSYHGRVAFSVPAEQVKRLCPLDMVCLRFGDPAARGNNNWKEPRAMRMYSRTWRAKQKPAPRVQCVRREDAIAAGLQPKSTNAKPRLESADTIAEAGPEGPSAAGAGRSKCPKRKRPTVGQSTGRVQQPSEAQVERTDTTITPGDVTDDAALASVSSSRFWYFGFAPRPTDGGNGMSK